MNNLLDTHTVIWFINGNDEISSKAINTIVSNPEGNYVSIVSLWEIAIKKSINKLDLKFTFQDFNQEIIKNGFKILPITYQDTFLVSQMPFHHNDPFDRIIIAQAQNNNFNLISTDKHFSSYNVNLIW
jgi:PIN domain nuclease of toxin-antitoxin system